MRITTPGQESANYGMEISDFKLMGKVTELSLQNVTITKITGATNVMMV